MTLDRLRARLNRHIISSCPVCRDRGEFQCPELRALALAVRDVERGWRSVKEVVDTDPQPGAS